MAEPNALAYHSRLSPFQGSSFVPWAMSPAAGSMEKCLPLGVAFRISRSLTLTQSGAFQAIAGLYQNPGEQVHHPKE